MTIDPDIIVREFNLIVEEFGIHDFVDPVLDQTSGKSVSRPSVKTQKKVLTKSTPSATTTSKTSSSSIFGSSTSKPSSVGKTSGKTLSTTLSKAPIGPTPSTGTRNSQTKAPNGSVSSTQTKQPTKPTSDKKPTPNGKTGSGTQIALADKAKKSTQATMNQAPGSQKGGFVSAIKGGITSFVSNPDNVAKLANGASSLGQAALTMAPSVAYGTQVLVDKFRGSGNAAQYYDTNTVQQEQYPPQQQQQQQYPPQQQQQYPPQQQQQYPPQQQQQYPPQQQQQYPPQQQQQQYPPQQQQQYPPQQQQYPPQQQQQYPPQQQQQQQYPPQQQQQQQYPPQQLQQQTDQLINTSPIQNNIQYIPYNNQLSYPVTEIQNPMPLVLQNPIYPTGLAPARDTMMDAAYNSPHRAFLVPTMGSKKSSRFVEDRVTFSGIDKNFNTLPSTTLADKTRIVVPKQQKKSIWQKVWDWCYINQWFPQNDAQDLVKLIGEENFKTPNQIMNSIKVHITSGTRNNSGITPDIEAWSKNTMGALLECCSIGPEHVPWDEDIENALGHVKDTLLKYYKDIQRADSEYETVRKKIKATQFIPEPIQGNDAEMRSNLSCRVIVPVLLARHLAPLMDKLREICGSEHSQESTPEKPTEKQVADKIESLLKIGTIDRMVNFFYNLLKETVRTHADESKDGLSYYLPIEKENFATLLTDSLLGSNPIQLMIDYILTPQSSYGGETVRTYRSSIPDKLMAIADTQDMTKGKVEKLKKALIGAFNIRVNQLADISNWMDVKAANVAARKVVDGHKISYHPDTGLTIHRLVDTTDGSSLEREETVDIGGLTGGGEMIGVLTRIFSIFKPTRPLAIVDSHKTLRVNYDASVDKYPGNGIENTITLSHEGRKLELSATADQVINDHICFGYLISEMGRVDPSSALNGELVSLREAFKKLQPRELETIRGRTPELHKKISNLLKVDSYDIVQKFLRNASNASLLGTIRAEVESCHAYSFNHMTTPRINSLFSTFTKQAFGSEPFSPEVHALTCSLILELEKERLCMDAVWERTRWALVEQPKGGDASSIFMDMTEAGPHHWRRRQQRRLLNRNINTAVVMSNLLPHRYDIIGHPFYHTVPLSRHIGPLLPPLPHSHQPHSHQPHSHQPYSHQPHSHQPYSHQPYHQQHQRSVGPGPLVHTRSGKVRSSGITTGSGFLVDEPRLHTVVRKGLVAGFCKHVNEAILSEEERYDAMTMDACYKNIYTSDGKNMMGSLNTDRRVPSAKYFYDKLVSELATLDESNKERAALLAKQKDLIDSTTSNTISEGKGRALIRAENENAEMWKSSIKKIKNISEGLYLFYKVVASAVEVLDGTPTTQGTPNQGSVPTLSPSTSSIPSVVESKVSENVTRGGGRFSFDEIKETLPQSTIKSLNATITQMQQEKSQLKDILISLPEDVLRGNTHSVTRGKLTEQIIKMSETAKEWAQKTKDLDMKIETHRYILDDKTIEEICQVSNQGCGLIGSDLAIFHTDKLLAVEKSFATLDQNYMQVIGSVPSETLQLKQGTFEKIYQSMSDHIRLALDGLSERSGDLANKAHIFIRGTYTETTTKASEAIASIRSEYPTTAEAIHRVTAVCCRILDSVNSGASWLIFSFIELIGKLRPWLNWLGVVAKVVSAITKITALYSSLMLWFSSGSFAVYGLSGSLLGFLSSIPVIGPAVAVTVLCTMMGYLVATIIDEVGNWLGYDIRIVDSIMDAISGIAREMCRKSADWLGLSRAGKTDAIIESALMAGTRDSSDLEQLFYTIIDSVDSPNSYDVEKLKRIVEPQSDSTPPRADNQKSNIDGGGMSTSSIHSPLQHSEGKQVVRPTSNKTKESTKKRKHTRDDQDSNDQGTVQTRNSNEKYESNQKKTKHSTLVRTIIPIDPVDKLINEITTKIKGEDGAVNWSILDDLLTRAPAGADSLINYKQLCANLVACGLSMNRVIQKVETTADNLKPKDTVEFEKHFNQIKSTMKSYIQRMLNFSIYVITREKTEEPEGKIAEMVSGNDECLSLIDRCFLGEGSLAHNLDEEYSHEEYDELQMEEAKNEWFKKFKKGTMTSIIRSHVAKKKELGQSTLSDTDDEEGSEAANLSTRLQSAYIKALKEGGVPRSTLSGIEENMITKLVRQMLSAEEDRLERKKELEKNRAKDENLLLSFNAFSQSVEAMKHSYKNGSVDLYVGRLLARYGRTMSERLNEFVKYFFKSNESVQGLTGGPTGGCVFSYTFKLTMDVDSDADRKDQEDYEADLDKQQGGKSAQPNEGRQSGKSDKVKEKEGIQPMVAPFISFHFKMDKDGLFRAEMDCGPETRLCFGRKTKEDVSSTFYDTDKIFREVTTHISSIQATVGSLVANYKFPTENSTTRVESSDDLIRMLKVWKDANKETKTHIIGTDPDYRNFVTLDKADIDKVMNLALKPDKIIGMSNAINSVYTLKEEETALVVWHYFGNYLYDTLSNFGKTTSHKTTKSANSSKTTKSVNSSKTSSSETVSNEARISVLTSKLNQLLSQYRELSILSSVIVFDDRWSVGDDIITDLRDENIPTSKSVRSNALFATTLKSATEACFNALCRIVSIQNWNRISKLLDSDVELMTYIKSCTEVVVKGYSKNTRMKAAIKHSKNNGLNAPYKLFRSIIRVFLEENQRFIESDSERVKYNNHISKIFSLDYITLESVIKQATEGTNYKLEWMNHLHESGPIGDEPYFVEESLEWFVAPSEILDVSLDPTSRSFTFGRYMPYIDLVEIASETELIHSTKTQNQIKNGYLNEGMLRYVVPPNYAYITVGQEDFTRKIKRMTERVIDSTSLFDSNEKRRIDASHEYSFSMAIMNMDLPPSLLSSHARKLISDYYIRDAHIRERTQLTMKKIKSIGSAHNGEEEEGRPGEQVAVRKTVKKISDTRAEKNKTRTRQQSTAQDKAVAQDKSTDSKSNLRSIKKITSKSEKSAPQHRVAYLTLPLWFFSVCNHNFLYYGNLFTWSELNLVTLFPKTVNHTASMANLDSYQQSCERLGQQTARILEKFHHFAKAGHWGSKIWNLIQMFEDNIVSLNKCLIAYMEGPKKASYDINSHVEKNDDIPAKAGAQYKLCKYIYDSLEEISKYVSQNDTPINNDSMVKHLQKYDSELDTLRSNLHMRNDRLDRPTLTTKRNSVTPPPMGLSDIIYRDFAVLDSYMLDCANRALDRTGTPSKEEDNAQILSMQALYERVDLHAQAPTKGDGKKHKSTSNTTRSTIHNSETWKRISQIAKNKVDRFSGEYAPSKDADLALLFNSRSKVINAFVTLFDKMSESLKKKILSFNPLRGNTIYDEVRWETVVPCPRIDSEMDDFGDLSHLTKWAHNHDGQYLGFESNIGNELPDNGVSHSLSVTNYIERIMKTQPNEKSTSTATSTEGAKLAVNWVTAWILNGLVRNDSEEETDVNNLFETRFRGISDNIYQDGDLQDEHNVVRRLSQYYQFPGIDSKPSDFSYWVNKASKHFTEDAYNLQIQFFKKISDRIPQLRKDGNKEETEGYDTGDELFNTIEHDEEESDEEESDEEEDSSSDNEEELSENDEEGEYSDDDPMSDSE